MITGIPRTPEKAHCWLLDPEPDRIERPARQVRLLARLQFLHWIIWLVSPRSALALVLGARTQDLEAMRDPFELDRLTLRQANGEPIPYREALYGGDRFSPFFASRCRVVDSPAGGVVVPTPDRNYLLFIGLRTTLLQLAVEQNFDEILSYEAPTTIGRKTVACVVPKGEFSEFGIDAPERSRARDAYVRFTAVGTLMYTKEGLVFGFLPLSDVGTSTRLWL